MITKEQLNSIGYREDPSEKGLYTVPCVWEYGFNIKTQELWYLNDGFDEPEFIVKETDFEKLKKILEIYGELY
jgi:hypothetical protein